MIIITARLKYTDGYIFDNGIQLIKRLNKENNDWNCICKCPLCGSIFKTKLYSVSKNDTKSCGCLDKKHRKEFGEQAKTNYVGKRFGKLLVIEETEERTNDGSIIYKCKCDCGKDCYVSSKLLSSGDTKSCGCLKHETGQYLIKDLTGQKFGKLTVINDSKIRKNNKVIWNCRCDCGNIVQVRGNDLKNGKILSCGCIKQSYYACQIEQILYQENIKFIKEKTFKDCLNPKTGYKLRFDFYLPDYNCCIEYDGEQHEKAYDFWKGEEGLIFRKEMDNIKNEYCTIHKIKLIRISYHDKKQISCDFILNKIKN